MCTYVYTIGNEATLTKLCKEMCMVNIVVCVPVEYVNNTRNSRYLNDTVNEGQYDNKNDLHTKDKFDHQNGLCYGANTCFTSEKWTITLQ